eukprot:157218_1
MSLAKGAAGVVRRKVPFGAKPGFKKWVPPVGAPYIIDNDMHGRTMMNHMFLYSLIGLPPAMIYYHFAFTKRLEGWDHDFDTYMQRQKRHRIDPKRIERIKNDYTKSEVVADDDEFGRIVEKEMIEYLTLQTPEELRAFEERDRPHIRNKEREYCRQKEFLLTEPYFRYQSQDLAVLSYYVDQARAEKLEAEEDD